VIQECKTEQHIPNELVVLLQLTCSHGQVFKTDSTKNLHNQVFKGGHRPTSSRTITWKETLVEKISHPINPHTEVDTSAKEVPSGDVDEYSAEKGEDIKSAISRFKHG
jgi:hypothetical protein